MPKFKCCLKMDLEDGDNNEWHEIPSWDAETAAEEYADYAWGERDMHEGGMDAWEDENMVVVRGDDEVLHYFIIEPEAAVNFYVKEVDETGEDKQ